ncbi:MAG: hypothetical protein ABW328_22280 [Ilumatobacteraceae bacterium]
MDDTHEPDRSHEAASAAGVATEPSNPRQLLAVYLRDHLAGAAAGLSLAERCQHSNAGTALGDVLAEIVTEIAADRQALVGIMDGLAVSENHLKSVLGKAAELVGRVKSNGTLVHYSPSSRVAELEGLLAGIDAKRNLWRSLRIAASVDDALDPVELDHLIERATSQRDRLAVEHDRAARIAFAPPVGADRPTL